MAPQRAFIWFLVLVGLLALEVCATKSQRQSVANSSTTIKHRRRTTATTIAVPTVKAVEKPTAAAIALFESASNGNASSATQLSPSTLTIRPKRRRHPKRKTRKHHPPTTISTTRLPINSNISAAVEEPVEDELPPHYFTFSRRSSYQSRLGNDPVFSSSENYHLYPTYDDYHSANAGQGSDKAKEAESKSVKAKVEAPQQQQQQPRRRCQTIQKSMPHQSTGGHRKMMTCYVCGDRSDPYNNGGYTEECNFSPNEGGEQVAAAPTTSHADKVYAGHGHAPYLNYQYHPQKASSSSDSGREGDRRGGRGGGGERGYDEYNDQPNDKAEQTEKSSCKIVYKGKMKCKVCGSSKQGGAYSEQCDYEADDPGHHGQRSYDYSSANEKNYQSPKGHNGGGGGGHEGGGHGGGGGGHGGGGGGGGRGDNYGNYGNDNYGGDNYGGGGGHGGYGGGGSGGGYGGNDNYGGGGYGGYPDYGGYGSGTGLREPTYESLCKNPFFSYSYGCNNYGNEGYGGGGGGGGGASHGDSKSKKGNGGGDDYKGSSDTRHDYSHGRGGEEEIPASSNSGGKGQHVAGADGKSKKNCKIVYKDFESYSPYGSSKGEKKENQNKPKMKCEVCVRSDGYGGVTEECNYTGGGELTAAFPNAGDLESFFGQPHSDTDKYYSGNDGDNFRDAYY